MDHEKCKIKTPSKFSTVQYSLQLKHAILSSLAFIQCSILFFLYQQITMSVPRGEDVNPTRYASTCQAATTVRVLVVTSELGNVAEQVRHVNVSSNC